MRTRQLIIKLPGGTHRSSQRRPNGPLEDVVEALAFAGFPPRYTIMGATQYSTSLYPGESEYTHRQVIIDKMKAVGYPANEVDDAVADIWRG